MGVDPGGTRKCDANGCWKNTREGKPFCPDHVGHNPYVAEILARLAAEEAERKRLTPSEMILEEILVVLVGRGGVASVRFVAKTTTYETKLVTKAFEILARRKRVKLTTTNRGSLMARLTERRT